MNSSALPPCHNGNGTFPGSRFIESSDSLYVLSTILGSIAMVLSLACLIFNVLLRNNRTVKMSSPRLNMVISTGAILASLCCILMGLDSFLVVDTLASNTLCQIRQGLVYVSVSLTFGPMVGKTWRVNQIFKLAGSKRVVIRDIRLLVYTSTLLLLDVGVFTLWHLMDRITFSHVVYLEQTTGSRPQDIELINDITVTTACTSERPWLMSFTLVAIKLPVLLFGMREAWWTRGMILPQLNDSTALTISTLTTVTMTTVYVATGVAFRDKPQITSVVSICCLWVAIVTTMLVLLLPKLLLWKQTPKGHLSHRVSISSTCSSAAVLQSFEQMETGLLSANAEIKTLKGFIHEKEMNIEKLQALLNDAEENLAQLQFEPISPISDCCVFDEPDQNTDDRLNNNNNNCNNNNNNTNGIDNSDICYNSTSSNNALDASTCSHCNNNPSPHNLSNNHCSCCDSSHLSCDRNHHSYQHNHHYCNNQLQTSGSGLHSRRRRSYDSLSSRTNSRITSCSCSCCCQSGEMDSRCHSNAPGSIKGSDTSTVFEFNRPFRVSFPPEQQTLCVKGSSSSFKIPSPTTHYMDYSNGGIGSERRSPVFPKSRSNLVFGYSSDIEGGEVQIDTTNAKRYYRQRHNPRRRRSSTPSVSSVSSIEKLNRLRSDLNDALALSVSLKSGWSTDLARAMTRTRRTQKNYDREKRQTVIGLQHITDSIMASYDYQKSFDNKSYISDCLTTASSEGTASDLHMTKTERKSRGGNATSGNLKKILQRRRQSVPNVENAPSPSPSPSSSPPSFNNVIFSKTSNRESIRLGHNRDNKYGPGYTVTWSNATPDCDTLGVFDKSAIRGGENNNMENVAYHNTHTGIKIYDVDCTSSSKPRILDSKHSMSPSDSRREEKRHASSTINNDSLYPTQNKSMMKVPSSESMSSIRQQPQTIRFNLNDGNDGIRQPFPKEIGYKNNTSGVHPQGINSSFRRHGNALRQNGRAIKATVTFADLVCNDQGHGQSPKPSATSVRALPRSQSDNVLYSLTSPTNCILSKKRRLIEDEAPYSGSVGNAHRGRGHIRIESSHSGDSFA